LRQDPALRRVAGFERLGYRHGPYQGSRRSTGDALDWENGRLAGQRETRQSWHDVHVARTQPATNNGTRLPAGSKHSRDQSWSLKTHNVKRGILLAQSGASHVSEGPVGAMLIGRRLPALGIFSWKSTLCDLLNITVFHTMRLSNRHSRCTPQPQVPNSQGLPYALPPAL